jgi:hypothetical protein
LFNCLDPAGVQTRLVFRCLEYNVQSAFAKRQEFCQAKIIFMFLDYRNVKIAIPSLVPKRLERLEHDDRKIEPVMVSLPHHGTA